MDNSKKGNKDIYDDLPSLTRLLQTNQDENETYNTDRIPPIFCTTTSYVSETLNSDPCLMKSTMYKVPVSEYALVESAIPFSIVLTPFSEKANVNTIGSIERCQSCRSLASRLTINMGSGLMCSICEKPSVVLDTNVLNCPTYDVIKKDEKIKLPIFTIILDLSAGIIFTQTLSALKKLFEDESFLYLYKKIVFLVLNGPKIMTFQEHTDRLNVLNIDGMAAPIVFDDICIENTSNWNFIIEHIGVMKVSNGLHVEERVYLKLLENISQYGPVNAMLFTNKTSEFNFEEYLERNKNICLNLFTTNENKMNTLSRLAFYSTGRVFLYKPNNVCLEYNLKQIACTKSVFNLTIQMRASGNVVKTDVIAPTLHNSLGKVYMNHMNPSTTILYNLSLSEPSAKNKCLQVELNYIDYDGCSKMRVLNMELQTDKMVYTGLSFDAIFTAYVKMKLDDDVNLGEQLSRMFCAYRIKNGFRKDVNLVMPNLLSGLPVLFQAYDKMDEPDYKFLFGASSEQCIRYFYPTLISLSAYALNPQTATLRLTKRNIEDGEVYFLENSREIYFFVARNVDNLLLSSIFTNPQEIGKNITLVDFNQNTSEGKMCYQIVEGIFNRYGYELRMKVIHAGQPDEINIQKYMIEDDVNAKGDYSSYIYTLHYDIKKRMGD